MQHIENDMDDLFSKAGENYPLDTSGSNWESVRGALYEGNAALPAKKTNYRRFLWLLLLLLPFAWLNYHNKPELASETHLNASAGEQNIAGTIKTAPGIKNNNSAEVTEGNTAVTKNNNSKNKETVIKIPTLKSAEDISVAKTNSTPASKNLAIVKKETISSTKKNKIQKEFLLKESSINNSNKTLLSNNKSPLVNNTEKELQYANLNNILAPLYGSYSNDNIKKQLALANPITQNPVSTNNKAKQKVKKQSAFYAGLIVGPDASWIRSQKVKTPGYSVGLNVGYRINKHFAVEIGALYDQKKYFTDGEYFNKTGAGVPPNVTIEWLNGGCKMFEFPLLARYNFNIKKSAFFVSGGLTSYIMKNENYKYSAVANGTWYEGHRSYDNSGNHLFANLQWSLGYNVKLSPKTQLRFEPYIKVPVKNIGIGKMPITSSGIYFGITRDLK